MQLSGATPVMMSPLAPLLSRERGTETGTAAP
jgi:hypothetical protein